jgi:hypothetical protein
MRAKKVHVERRYVSVQKYYDSRQNKLVQKLELGRLDGSGRVLGDVTAHPNTRPPVGTPELAGVLLTSS